MKKSQLLGTTCAVVFMTLTNHANSALEPRLCDENDENCQAYYDTEKELTWLQPKIFSPMSWGDANTYLSPDLDVEGVTDWRLPTTDIDDHTCYNPNGSTENHFGYGCKGSELGNLFLNHILPHVKRNESLEYNCSEVKFDFGDTSFCGNPNKSFTFWSDQNDGENAFVFLIRFSYDNVSELNALGYQSQLQKTDQGGLTWAVKDGDVFGIVDPVEKLAGLIEDVMTTNKNMGLLNSLDSKFNTAIQAMDDANTNNDVAAINSLYAFIYSVDAQRGQLISDEDATALIEAAQAIIDSLSAN